MPAKTAATKAAPAKKATATRKPATKAPAKTAAPATKATATKAPAKTSAPKAAAAAAPAAAPPAKAAAPKRGGNKGAQREPVIRTPQSEVSAARKAPGPTTSPTEPHALVVREDEDPWTKVELNEVRSELRDEVKRLRDELDMAEHEIDDMLRDSGDGAGDDAADAGSKTFEREHEMSLANNTRDMLVQAERALARIDNGSYGICENCGNPIGKARLQVFPRATLCMTCKQREERR